MIVGKGSKSVGDAPLDLGEFGVKQLLKVFYAVG